MKKAQGEILPPDDFPLKPRDPNAQQQRMLSELLQEAVCYNKAKQACWIFKPSKLKTVRSLLASKPEFQAAFVLACCDRLQWLAKLEERYQTEYFRPGSRTRPDKWNKFEGLRNLTCDLRTDLLRQHLPFDRAGIRTLLSWTLKHDWPIREQSLPHVERYISTHGLDEKLRAMLENWRNSLDDKDSKIRRLMKILGEQVEVIGGEKWSEQWLAALKKENSITRSQWSTLVGYAARASGSKPSNKWVQVAKPLLEKIGEENFASRLETALGDLASSSDQVHPRNAEILKGLLWCAPLAENAELCRALGDVIPHLFKTVEHVHQHPYGEEYDYATVAPRAPSLGNAAIYALSQMQSVSAVTHLARTRLKLRHGSALKAVEKALGEVAKRLNVSPSDLEELAVPEFGLHNGVLTRAFGEWTAEIDFHSGKAQWAWRAENKKPPKAVPAAVKAEYSSQLKELKAQVAEIEKLFPAQKDRLDLLLREEKTWPLATWRERYLQHSFLGMIASRVIWEWSDDNENWRAFLPLKKWIDLNGDAAPAPENAHIRLWHPIRQSADEVLAWRRLLEEKQVRQPFKQAHREVYLLTDAERNTRIYSNRFAAHIIRQHQFNALCATRGWKNKLRLMVDDVAPPATKELPQHNLRAEFWIEGIGDEYSVDTNDTGTYYRLATDQVRFYRLDAPQNYAQIGGGGFAPNNHWDGRNLELQEPVPLEEIPSLVFSEVMRDVDLFVGVASVGNDPTWSDGGPQGRYINYWQEYSFGALSQTAQTRRDVLSRLLPKLKIKERCELRDRFLLVRGDLRTYKIHLGSGNILMEPNDQYLCIVPSRGASTSDNLFLPFEGDGTMSVILSKAFLLSDDTKITDTTITSQIKA